MSGRNVKQYLEASIYDTTRTIDLMDRFEGYGSDIAYQKLALCNIACLKIGEEYEYVTLIIERSRDYRYVGNITFTELKQGQVADLYKFLRSNISKDIVEDYKGRNEEYRFDTPYLLRAQNSTNRSGYGWGFGGTQYGETTAYVFTGAFIGYRKRGFTSEINALIDNADLSEFTIKNVSNNPSEDTVEMASSEILLFDDDSEIDDPILDVQNDEDQEISFVCEKRNLPDLENRPLWYYSGFSFETNMFILALEQKIYLPPIIDECENLMITDENIVHSEDLVLTDLEKTLMFVEMLANSIGYSGSSVMSLDIIHKRKILNGLLVRNFGKYEIAEYGENSISLHLVGEFLDNQPELQYRGFVEIILSKYYDADDKPVYELFGGFRDFGDDEVVSTKRKYWIGNDRFLLDEDKDGSYLQGIYEMIMSY